MLWRKQKETVHNVVCNVTVNMRQMRSFVEINAQWISLEKLPLTEVAAAFTYLLKTLFVSHLLFFFKQASCVFNLVWFVLCSLPDPFF